MKKVLSFVLVLAMILGCFTVAFADYPDADAITNKEAVAVLSAVDVFEGDDNGNMRPTATLTRAEACKIIACLMLGTAEAKKLTAAGAPFADVAADYWAAGYIAYCAAEGIVAGVGNNNFNPTGTLKVGEFGKMLLCVLGYNAATEGLTGSDWASNVTKLMVKSGLTVEQSNTADCAREVAAQLALNALQADMVDYDTKGSSVTVGNTTLNISGSKAEVIEAKGSVASTKYNSIGKSTTPDGIVQLGEELFAGKLVVEAVTNGDGFGRAAHIWTYKSEEIGTYSDEKAVKTYTAGKLATALTTELKGYVISAAAADVYVNGSSDSAVVGVASLAALTGNGRTVELYATNAESPKNIDKIVVIDEYLAQVSKVDATNKTITYKVFSSSVGNPSAATEVGYGAYAKDDYVVVTMIGNEVQSVKSAEKVSGVISGNKTNTKGYTEFTLDGTVYKVAYTSAAGINAGVGSTVCDAYLDSYGYVLKVNGQVGSENYLLATKVFNENGSLGSVVSKAQVVFPDGRAEVVELATTVGLYDTTPTGLYTYSVVNNKYTLTQATTEGGVASYGHYTEASISTNNNLGYHYFGSNVNFVTVVNAAKTSIDVKTYTGKQKISEKVGLYYVTDKLAADATGASITLVFALSGISTDTNDLVYIVSGSAANGTVTLADGTTKKTQELYISGVKSTVPVKDEAKAGNAFYTMSIDEKGVYTLVEETANKVTDGAVKFVYGNEVIIDDLNGTKSTACDDDIVIVDLRKDVEDSDKVTSVADLETLVAEATPDTVKVAAAYNATSKTVTYIYVTAATIPQP